MTIASTITQQRYACNGTTTQFSFGNKIFTAADLVAVLIDTLGNLYTFTLSGVNTYTNVGLGISYTVNNVDIDTGCFITFTAAPANGWTLDLRTVIAELQSTSIKNQGSFLPELHEEFFDKATRMLQDLYRRTYTFGIHGPDNENTPWTQLPAAALRANTNLGFDSSGNVAVSQALVAGTLSRASIGAFLYPRSPQEVAASVTPTDLSWPTTPYHDIRRYGFVGDGTTDDSAAWNKLGLVIGQGASGFTPEGPTMVKSQVTITAPAYQRVSLFAYGTQIYTTGAIYAMNIIGGFMGGLTVYGASHMNYTDALALGGFNIFGAQNIALVECVGEGSTTLTTTANYSPFVLQPSDPTNDNTGPFWNRIVRCITRTSTTPVQLIPHGVLLLGAANATTISDCNFEGTTNNISILNQIGGSNTGALANALLVQGCAMEGGTNGIYVNGQSSVAAGNTISGLRLIGNRGELLTNFLSINGVGADSAVPTMLYGNYLVSNVTNYFASTGAVTPSIASWDPSVTPAYAGSVNQSMIGYYGFKFRALNNAVDSVQSIAQNVGSGFGLYSVTGTDLWHARMRSGAGAQITAPNGSWYLNVNSISATATEAKNLRGTATFAAATTVVVTFGTAEPDASYFISLSGNAAGFCWVTGKGTSGFTINCSASNSNAVDWHLIR